MFNLSHGFTAGFCWYVAAFPQKDGLKTRFSFEIEFLDHNSGAAGRITNYNQDDSATWWLDEAYAAWKAVEACLTLQKAHSDLRSLSVVQKEHHEQTT